MRAAVLLGLRLAGAGAGSARVRTGLMALATAIGTLLMLTIVAIAQAEQAQHRGLYDSPEMRRLLAAIVLSVALPVLVLVVTAGRLSAQLRDRRLANLRLLGLSPRQTRTVAAAEAATAAFAGLLVGRLLFVGVRLLLPHLHVAGRHWTAAALAPPVGAQVMVLGGVLAAVVAVAVLPQRLSMSSVLARARTDDARRPSLLRVLPLLLGVALCGFAMASARPDHSASGTVFLAFFAGVGLLGIGLILLVPVLVRLLADGLLRILPGPTGTVAARRLQAQPVGVTRVVSGLLIGLFLVTGARAVVVAFENTPQYQQAARQLEGGQRIALAATPAQAGALTSRVERVQGVRQVLRLRLLSTAGRCTQMGCLQALVATCAQLHLVAPGLTGCREGQPMWLDRQGFGEVHDAPKQTWFAMRDYRPLPGSRPLATTPGPRLSLQGDAWSQLQPLDAQVLLPPAALAGTSLPARAQLDLLALGVPGRGLLIRLQRAGLGPAMTGNEWDFQAYDYAAGLRAMVWSIAAVILSVGLLSFAVAAIDRAMSRRREVVGLQLVGVPPSVLRRVQWIEAGLPIVVGTMLAIGLGLFGGATYLSLGGELASAPVGQALTLAGIAAVSALLIAGLTVLGASPRLRPELIRAE